jgi:1-deoxy-D-xylulose-5-phosphate synthase
LLALSRESRLVVTVEDNVSTGGLGDAWARALRQQHRPPDLLTLALPPTFIPHASRQSLLARHGLDASGIAAAIRAQVDRAVTLEERRQHVTCSSALPTEFQHPLVLKDS